MEGSVRCSGTRIRITAQLIEAVTGHHVWAEKYDRELTDIFDLQDEITQNVAASTQQKILVHEGQSTKASRQNMNTWALVAQSWGCIYELTEHSLERAQELAEQALKGDPSSPRAKAVLAAAMVHRAFMGFLRQGRYEAVLQARKLIDESVRDDDSDEYSHWVRGDILDTMKNNQEAIASLSRAISLNPNFSVAHGSLGRVLALAGRSDEAEQHLQFAIRTNPRDPSIFFLYTGLAIHHLQGRDYENAISWAARAVDRKPQWRLGHAVLISALGNTSDRHRTESSLTAYLREFPEATVAEWRNLAFTSADDLAHFLGGLRRAGLPE